MEKTYFKEVQRFRQWWFLLLLFTSFLVGPILIIAEVISEGLAAEGQSDTLITLAVVLLIEVPLALVLLRSYLAVQIRNTGVWYRFPPLIYRWRCISPQEIKSFEVLTYKPLLEYGGWGIRWAGKRTAYSVGGNTGLKINLLNGKSVLLGTLQKSSVRLAMDKMMNANKAL